MLRRFALFAWRFFALAVCTLVGACYYLPPEVVSTQQSVAPLERIEGITDLTSNGSQTIRILFIHGIGIHIACDPDTLLVHLTKALHVVQKPPASVDDVNDTQGCASHFIIPKPVPIAAPRATDTALIYFYEFEGADARVVKFAFLRWSPLTDTIKKTDLQEPGLPHQAWLADYAKSFEQNNLVDVVLYGGRYREVIRPAIERGLCLFVEGSPDQADPRLCDGGKGDIPTAIVTHSLGGYILMDAMSDIYRRRRNATEHDARSAAEKVGRYLNQTFMLANQLKLLNLTTRNAEFETPATVADFRRSWEGAKAGGPPKRQLIAVSDPNDVLSWQVTTTEFNRPNFTVANVYLGVAGEFFGLYAAPVIPIAASPIDAHENYLKSDDVMDIIACGMTGSSINRCTQ